MTASSPRLLPFLPTGVLGVLCLAATATAQTTVSPSVFASIHDAPMDGVGDSFNASPFEGLIREISPSQEDRAIQEFDVSAFVGQTLSSAVISGSVHVNNAFDNGVRTFDFQLYAGNGAADLADFHSPGVVVGSGSYHPPVDSSFAFSFDITAELQTILDGGGNWLGLRVDPTSSPNFPNILGSGTVLTIHTGTPSGAYCFGDGSGAPCPCGNAGAAGRGCANSASAQGAVLSASGAPSVSGNTLVLSGASLAPGQPGLYFQGDNAVAGGAGVPFGDGLRCAGGGVVRIEVVAADATGASATSIDIAAKTGVTAGQTKRYQLWYRDPNGSPCGTGFNLSNGLERQP